MSHLSHTGIKLHNNNQTGEYGLPNRPPFAQHHFFLGGGCYFSFTSLAESSQQCCFMLACCEIDFAWLQADCIDSKRVFLVADRRNETEGFMASGNRGTWSKRLKQNQRWDKIRVALLLWLLVTLFFFGEQHNSSQHVMHNDHGWAFFSPHFSMASCECDSASLIFHSVYFSHIKRSQNDTVVWVFLVLPLDVTVGGRSGQFNIMKHLKYNKRPHKRNKS